MKRERFRYMSCIVVMCIIQSMLAMSLSAQDQEDSGGLLVLATDYPPYEFEHPDGELPGFDVEVVEDAFKWVGMSVKFVFYPWARALQMTEEGKATAALSCSKGPDREEFILFSEPIGSMTDIFLIRKVFLNQGYRGVRRKSVFGCVGIQFSLGETLPASWSKGRAVTFS